MQMAESYQNGYKTMWEKEKLFVTNNFSFSRSVFKRVVLQTRKNKGLFGKGLTTLKRHAQKTPTRKRVREKTSISIHYLTLYQTTKFQAGSN